MWQALALFALWTGATYALEGAPGTLTRPEAAGLRVVYAIIANLLIGVVGGGLVVRHLTRQGRLAATAAGFGSGRRSAAATAIGLVLGAVLYLLQGAPSLHPAVLVNAFAQVLPVSAAEVIVCWAVVGAAAERSWRSRREATVLAAIVASALFGLYHLAHSTPFNTLPMIGTLTIVGLGTSLFFFGGRDVIGTVAFHNFLAVFGVLRALGQAGPLARYESLQPSLLTLAAIAVGLLLTIHRLVWGRGQSFPADRR